MSLNDWQWITGRLNLLVPILFALCQGRRKYQRRKEKKNYSLFLTLDFIFPVNPNFILKVEPVKINEKQNENLILM